MKDSSIDLDNVDISILRILQDDGAISNVELARRISLSPPAVHARIKRLEEMGYLRGYVGLVDREKLGYDMLCFVSVTLQSHQMEHVMGFRERVVNMPEVLECHFVTGEFDYLLKVIVRSRQELEQFLMERLTPIPGIARISTSLVLTEIKFTTSISL